MSQQTLSQTLLSREDKLQVIAALIKIVDKQGFVVPFVFNKMQRYFHLNKSNRNIILKHRQGGCSSGILADMYTDCITVPHTSCAVVSHETRATQRLLQRVHFYHSSMDEPRPEVGSESRSELSFTKMDSSIYVGTAGARAFGRGDTIQKALLSELAFYENAQKILTGVEDAVPLTGELTIECTPNGEDNLLFELWVAAREGRSPYKPFFFPWWWTEDFSIPFGSEYALEEDKGHLEYTPEEQELVDKNHITEPQIRWRRWKIAEKGNLFWQEYPEDEVTCFLTIGDPVFDITRLNEMATGCYEGKHHPDGWTEWIPPEKGVRYVLAADTSSGAPTGSYSAAVVLDDRWRVCATFQARIEPHMLATILKKMGKWYNLAELVVERNLTGYAVLGFLAGGTNLESEGVSLANYPNLYRQRDLLTRKITSNLGWWTNDQTKQYMQSRLKDNLGKIQLWDTNLVRQLRGHRYIKSKATSQTFNDLAIALMIACAVKEIAGGARGYMGNVKGWDW